MGWQSDILGFWFGLSEQQWWKGGEELDEMIRDRFLELWQEKRSLPASSFLGSADEALASVILFDQFPRNMFRGTAEQYSTDPLALAIAGSAVDSGLDDRLDERRRAFLYMPFQHSEDPDAQRRSLLLFSRLGDDEMLSYARKHHDIIERFGRFPHRNAVLGRSPRPEEVEAGDVTPW